MDKVQALERLKHLQTIIEAADYIDNVSWSSDIAPVEKLAKEIGVWNNPEVYASFEAISQGLTYNSNGRRRGITWTQIYNLFSVMRKAIEAMP